MPLRREAQGEPAARYDPRAAGGRRGRARLRRRSSRREPHGRGGPLRRPLHGHAPRREAQRRRDPRGGTLDRARRPPPGRAAVRLERDPTLVLPAPDGRPALRDGRRPRPRGRLPSGGARRGGRGVLSPRHPWRLAPPGDLRPHRPTADAGGARRLPRGRGAGGAGARRRSTACVSRFRRALGPALARPRPLRRDQGPRVRLPHPQRYRATTSSARSTRTSPTTASSPSSSRATWWRPRAWTRPGSGTSRSSAPAPGSSARRCTPPWSRGGIRPTA